VTLLPTLIRELRATGRQPFTYTLRILGVAALLAACAIAALGPGFSARGGARVFGYLHFTLFCAIWILVPLLTADCLSREQREGTLPLLFLTPLKPAEIVLAKGMAHGLRALSLWLAVLPVMMIPFLLGGVGWKEAVFSLALNFSAIALALTVGLLSSSICVVWQRSIICALLLSFLFAPLFALAHSVAVLGAISLFMPRVLVGFRSVSIFLHFTSDFIGDFGGIWSQGLISLPAKAQRAWLIADGGLVLLSLLSAAGVIWFAARRLKHIWREAGPSPRTERIKTAIERPIVGRLLLRRWLRWRLARNPVGWLEQRRVTGRLVIWGWIAITVLIYVGCGLDGSFYGDGFMKVQTVLAWLLMGSMAITAAGSFRRERESGMLELLLVSPLGEWALIAGRLRALWSQFLPVTVLFFAVSVFQAILFGSDESRAFLPYLGLVYVTLPVIGLYFSLARQQFIAALFWTLIFGGMLPFALGASGASAEIINSLFRAAPYPEDDAGWGFFLTLALQAGVAAVFALVLRHHLARRKFALQ